MNLEDTPLFKIFGPGSALSPEPPTATAVEHKGLVELFDDAAPATAPEAIREKENTNDSLVFLSPDTLLPYPGHLFRPYSDERLRELADDIAENGVISPICVRPQDSGHQILAGHNRTNAAKLAGLSQVPCIIKNCDDETAALIVVNTNLNQRDDLLPSEKARAYKIQMEYFNSRGKNVEKFMPKPDDIHENQEHCLLGKNKDGQRSIYRFIRLTYLISELLQMVDDGKLPIFAGEDLSHLGQNEQENVYHYFFVDKRGNLDIKTAKLLRQRATEVDLTYSEIERLLRKNMKSAVKPVRFSSKDFKKYIPAETSRKDALALILKALEEYYDNHKELLK